MSPAVFLDCFAVAFIAVNIAFAPGLYRTVYRLMLRRQPAGPLVMASLLIAIPQMLVLLPLTVRLPVNRVVSPEDQEVARMLLFLCIPLLLAALNFLYIRRILWVQRKSIVSERQSIGEMIFFVVFLLVSFAPVIVFDQTRSFFQPAPTLDPPGMEIRSIP